MTEEQEWPGLIRIPAMLPDGTITIVWWPAEVPLPESFIMRPRPDDPGTYEFIINTGVSP
jgi:hypothetical protein